MKLKREQIARAARSLNLAEQCIRKVLKLVNTEEQTHGFGPAFDVRLLNAERCAELEATCVILMRCRSIVWSKFEQGEK